jgi:hypothetical protein
MKIIICKQNCLQYAKVSSKTVTNSVIKKPQISLRLVYIIPKIGSNTTKCAHYFRIAPIFVTKLVKLCYTIRQIVELMCIILHFLSNFIPFHV